MLFTDSMENNVISRLSDEMSACENEDKINKLYRQARIWVRFHCYYAKACSPEHSQVLNNIIKGIRNSNISRVRNLGGGEDD